VCLLHHRLPRRPRARVTAMALPGLCSALVFARTHASPLARAARTTRINVRLAVLPPPARLHTAAAPLCPHSFSSHLGCVALPGLSTIRAAQRLLVASSARGVRVRCLSHRPRSAQGGRSPRVSEGSTVTPVFSSDRGLAVWLVSLAGVIPLVFLAVNMDVYTAIIHSAEFGTDAWGFEWIHLSCGGTLLFVSFVSLFFGRLYARRYVTWLGIKRQPVPLLVVRTHRLFGGTSEQLLPLEDYLYSQRTAAGDMTVLRFRNSRGNFMLDHGRGKVLNEEEFQALLAKKKPPQDGQA